MSDTINGIEINVYELNESNQSMDAVNIYPLKGN
jgi:hypothetical protein